MLKKTLLIVLVVGVVLVIGLAAGILLITGVFADSNSNVSAIDETRLPIVLPENVMLIDTINDEIAAESGRDPNAASVLLAKAQERNNSNVGIGIIIIEQSIKGNDGDKDIWSCSAVVIQMKDENFEGLYDILPRSSDRLYGSGSARMASTNMSMTTAESRARAEIVRLFNSTVEVSEGQTVTTSRAVITDSRIEQIVISPNGTAWVMVSVDKENVKAVE